MQICCSNKMNYNETKYTHYEDHIQSPGVHRWSWVSDDTALVRTLKPTTLNTKIHIEENLH